MAKKTYTAIHLIQTSDELGPQTVKPGGPLKLEPADKETVRLLRVGAIRLAGSDDPTPPAPQNPPVDEVDEARKAADAAHAAAEGANGDGDAGDAGDDGFGDKTATPPAAKPLTAAEKKAAAKAAAAATKK